MHRDPDAAEGMLLGLSDFLRLTPEDLGAHEVPLRRELEYLERYLALQRVRFGARLAVSVEVEPETLDSAVPPLVLQPLVENAIRHGVSRSVEGGTITVRGRRVGQALELSVADDGPGPARTAPAASERPGLGLANVRARLERLYGASQRLELSPGEERGFEVRIRVPARAVPGGALA